MAEQRRFKSPYRDNITTDRVLNLSTKNEQGKRANWTVKYTGNRVRLAVWTGIDGDTDNGKIDAVIDLNVWYVFLSMVEYIIKKSQSGESKTMEIKTLGPEGWAKGTIPRGTLYAGRDGNNAVFVSLVKPNRPKIAFPFVPSDFFSITNKDGSAADPSLVSNIIATSYVETSREVLGTLAGTEYVKKEDRPNQRGNNRGGNGGNSNYRNNNNNYKSNNNQNQSNSNPDSGFDSDDWGGDSDF